MDTYETYNDEPRKRLLQFFVPTIADVVLYQLISVMLLAALNWRAIGNIFREDAPLQPQLLHAVFTEKFSGVGNLFAKPVFGKISLLLFWAFVGCLAYMILWLIQYALATAREDFVEGQYIHPRSVDQRNYWHSIIAHNIFLFCSAMVCLGYIILSLRLFFPVLAKVFYIGIYSFPSYGSIFEVILAVFCSSLLFYIGRLLWQVLYAMWGMSKIPG